jgi:outer membrane protein assembly factor BamB
MSIRICGLSLAALVAPAAAQTTWEPVWSTTWAAAGAQSNHASVLRRADDGALFVGIEPGRAGSQRAGVLRVNADGTIGWAHERPTSAAADDVLPTADGRVALTGGFTMPFVRAIDADDGELAWETATTGATLQVLRTFSTRQIAQTPGGDLLVRAHHEDAFVVLRFDASGQLLPPWRWNSGLGAVWANSIVALADGGAIVTGRTFNLSGGFRTVRFAADGSIVYADVELGTFGSPLGMAWVAAAADGAAWVVASPETQFGMPGAMAWKIAADGTRLWTRELSDQSSGATTFSNGPAALGPGDDLWIATANTSPKVLGLIRVDGKTGQTRWNSQSSMPSYADTLAVAPSGRSLLGGSAHIPGGGGRTYAILAEFDANGVLCRERAVMDLYGFMSAVGDTEGWTVLGLGDDGVTVQRYDADGACGDALFADGFDG